MERKPSLELQLPASISPVSFRWRCSSCGYLSFSLETSPEGPSPLPETLYWELLQAASEGLPSRFLQGILSPLCCLLNCLPGHPSPAGDFSFSFCSLAQIRSTAVVDHSPDHRAPPESRQPSDEAD